MGLMHAETSCMAALWNDLFMCQAIFGGHAIVAQVNTEYRTEILTPCSPPPVYKTGVLGARKRQL